MEATDFLVFVSVVWPSDIFPLWVVLGKSNLCEAKFTQNVPFTKFPVSQQLNKRKPPSYGSDKMLQDIWTTKFEESVELICSSQRCRSSREFCCGFTFEQDRTKSMGNYGQNDKGGRVMFLLHRPVLRGRTFCLVPVY